MTEEIHESAAPDPAPLPDAKVPTESADPSAHSVPAARHGQEFWKPLIQEWRKSELTQEVFCRQKSVSLLAFQRWIQRLRARERRAQGGGVGESTTAAATAEPSSPFVPVAVRGESLAGSEEPAPLELALLGGRRVLRIRAAVPETLLCLVIRAAEALDDADPC
jgi:hypothetical protein